MKRLIVTFVLFTLTAAGVLQERSSKPRLDGRIVGGRPVPIADFPYQVSLMFLSNHICGGVIIAPFFIATAAHCTDGAFATEMSIRAGSTYHSIGGLVVGLAQFHQHPQYDPFTIDFDISILQLSLGLGTGVGVASIELPYPNQAFLAGTNAVVTGWGFLSEGSGVLSPQLQAVDVPIVSTEACREAYGQEEITDQMLCAGVPQGGLDACQGDSGGPLAIAGPVLVGLVSWGQGCARPNYPGVYSNVAILRTFITRIIGF